MPRRRRRSPSGGGKGGATRPPSPPSQAHRGDQASDSHSFHRGGGRNLRLAATTALIAAIWVVSDLGYYFLLPTLGVAPDYNLGSVAVSLYYVFWVGVAVIAFWPQYATWPRHAGWATFGNRLKSFAVWSVAFTAAVAFTAYVLPALPPFTPQNVSNPPQLPLATGWYFLPKSIDILFQQLLVAALVLSLAAERYSLRRISVLCALLFGGTHILLALGDVPWGYVTRFALLASVFGLAFPYLMLRVPNGLAYSYVAHWSYYAITVLMARTLGPSTVPELFKRLLDWV